MNFILHLEDTDQKNLTVPGTLFCVAPENELDTFWGSENTACLGLFLWLNMGVGVDF